MCKLVFVAFLAAVVLQSQRTAASDGSTTTSAPGLSLGLKLGPAPAPAPGLASSLTLEPAPRGDSLSKTILTSIANRPNLVYSALERAVKAEQEILNRLGERFTRVRNAIAPIIIDRVNRWNNRPRPFIENSIKFGFTGGAQAQNGQSAGR